MPRCVPCAVQRASRGAAQLTEVHVKRQTMPQGSAPDESDDGGLTDISAEVAVHREIGELGAWLAAQGFDTRRDHVHAPEGSRDQFYWRYGYFMGLNQALAMLTSHGTTTMH